MEIIQTLYKYGNEDDMLWTVQILLLKPCINHYVLRLMRDGVHIGKKKVY